MHLDSGKTARQFIRVLLAVILLIGPSNLRAGEVVVQEVVQGAATITQQPNNTFIEAGNNTIINYSQFDVDLGETATFIQPNSSSRVLNRVISVDPSYLLGTVTANGQVYFVNRSGVVIGSGAVINAAGFYAAAGDMSNSDFLAGTDKFTTSGGVLTNAGTINAPEGVALIGSKVLNTGTIISEHGVVALCAGDEVYLAQTGSGVKVRVDNLDANTGQGGTEPGQASSEAGVLNEGNVAGDEVLLSCGDVYSLAVINSGQVTAKGGKVTMSGAGLVQNEGQIDVSDGSEGATGGTVKMIGETVVLADAEIDASGQAGGGTVIIGGNYQGAGEERNSELTFVDAGSAIKADAVNTGDGGQIIVWSDGMTGFYGSLSAKGSQSGKGGFAEVSGVERLGFNGTANLSGGAGYGTLLLDPDDIVVANGGGAAYDDVDTFLSGSGTETIDADTLVAVVGDVSLQATNDITISEVLELSTSEQALTMRAGNDITIDAAVTTNSGDITMTANDSGGTQSGTGSIFVNANLSSTGGGAGADIVLNIDGGTGSVQLDAAMDAGTGTLSGNAETVYVMSSNASIQDGIDIVSGSTVYVVDDTYNESITISKSLLLIGLESTDPDVNAWGATAGASGNAPVIQSTTDPVITVSADDVTIRGIEINVNQGDAHKGISVTGGSDDLLVDHCTFTYNDTVSGDYLGDLAITFNPDTTNTVFDGSTISWNDFDTTATDSWAILMGNATNLEISNNSFDTGIRFEVGGGNQNSSDLLITSNTFNDFASTGIMFVRDDVNANGRISSGLEITQNDFDSRSIGIYFFATGDDEAADFDDSLQAGNFGDPVVIFENKFHSFAAGTEIALQVCDEANPVSLAIEIDARYNFWDDADGPTEANNKLDVGNQGAEISDNSDGDATLVYAPWWSVLTVDTLGAYEGTELSPVYNVQLDTSYASFALALAAASAGDELQATAGPYDEAVSIGLDVTVTMIETGLTGVEDWATATSWASTGGTAIGLDGNFATEGGNFTFLGDVELTGDCMLNSAGGAIQFANLTGDFNLTLEENIAAGATTFTGDVTDLGSGTGAALTVEDGVTGLVHFQGGLDTNSGISAPGTDAAVQVDDDVALGDGDTATTINGTLTIGPNCTSFSSYDGLTVETLAFAAGSTNSFALASNNGVTSFTEAIDFQARDLIINSTTEAMNFAGPVSNLGDGTGAALRMSEGATGWLTFESTVAANSGFSTADGTVIRFEDDTTITGGDTDTLVLGHFGLFDTTFTTDGAVTLGDDVADDVYFTGDAAVISTGNLTLGVDIISEAGTTITFTSTAGALVQERGTVTCNSLVLNAATGIFGPNLPETSGLDDELFLISTPLIEANVTGAADLGIRNVHDGTVTVNGLTTNGGHVVFQNADTLELTISGDVTSGTPAVTNGGIIAITSGGAVTVNAAVNSQSGSGGNLNVGDNVALNVAPTVGAGNILLAGNSPTGLALNLHANEISQVVARPEVSNAPVELGLSIAQRFQAADRNDDGLLSYPEFLGMLGVANSNGARRLFQAMDMNSDGLLTIEEIESYIRYRRGRSVRSPGLSGDTRVASTARH